MAKSKISWPYIQGTWAPGVIKERDDLGDERVLESLALGNGSRSNRWKVGGKFLVAGAGGGHCCCCRAGMSSGPGAASRAPTWLQGRGRTPWENGAGSPGHCHSPS